VSFRFGISSLPSLVLLDGAGKVASSVTNDPDAIHVTDP